MSESKNTVTEPKEEPAPFCTIAANGNMVGQRGSTFSNRKAIFLEKKEEEAASGKDRNGEEG